MVFSGGLQLPVSQDSSVAFGQVAFLKFRFEGAVYCDRRSNSNRVRSKTHAVLPGSSTVSSPLFAATYPKATLARPQAPSTLRHRVNGSSARQS
jgi:hypothetical protein